LKFLLLILTMLAQTDKPAAPQQPIPYSHKQHLAMGLKCQECHTNPAPGESMGIPAATKCMACHVSIAKDKPAIQKLAEAAKAKKEIPWVRVYQIPSFVAFSHKVHLETGAQCSRCHGDVAQREVLFKEGDISMGGCMNCHRENKASNDCGYCHEEK
jgi:hypothetical protein